ncbi:MAG: hypothetical protein ACE5Q6_08370 [Dehalococcoidia bacterium]
MIVTENGYVGNGFWVASAKQSFHVSASGGWLAVAALFFMAWRD